VITSGGESVAVRDSKDPNGAILGFSSEAWTGFLGGVKAGEFDRS
jgi:hypothetical protein